MCCPLLPQTACGNSDLNNEGEVLFSFPPHPHIERCLGVAYLPDGLTDPEDSGFGLLLQPVGVGGRVQAGHIKVPLKALFGLLMCLPVAMLDHALTALVLQVCTLSAVVAAAAELRTAPAKLRNASISRSVEIKPAAADAAGYSQLTVGGGWTMAENTHFKDEAGACLTP